MVSTPCKLRTKRKNFITCLVTVEPTTGTAAAGVSNTKFAGIWPAAENK